jgi:methionyl-tRNA formyltransferase
VIDENRTKRTNLVNHILSVAKRQAKVAGSSLPIALLRLVVFRLWSNFGRREEAVAVADLPETIPSFRVASINSAEAVDAVHACGSDASCLLGTRILTKSTIQELGHIILNGHASDPRFVRGRPPVFWEVLNGDGHICLTVHQAVQQLDAGPIYGQRLQEILYCGGIGATMRATMKQARLTMLDLFAEVLIGMHNRTITPIEFKPGPVRTLPRISQLMRAEILCRSRSKKFRPGSRSAGQFLLDPTQSR